MNGINILMEMINLNPYKFQNLKYCLNIQSKKSYNNKKIIKIIYLYLDYNITN